MAQPKHDGVRVYRSTYLRPIGFDAADDPITEVMIEVAPHQFVNERAFHQLNLVAARAA